MYTREKTLITLGVVLALTQVIGIPLLWKHWISALIGFFCVGWGLFLRHGKTSQMDVYEDKNTVA